MLTQAYVQMLTQVQICMLCFMLQGLLKEDFPQQGDLSPGFSQEQQQQQASRSSSTDASRGKGRVGAMDTLQKVWGSTSLQCPAMN